MSRPKFVNGWDSPQKQFAKFLLDEVREQEASAIRDMIRDKGLPFTGSLKCSKKLKVTNPEFDKVYPNMRKEWK